MRAAAILAPGTSERNLRPFRAADPSIEWTPDPTLADVILIFGGDGTVHRHLDHLVKLAKPVLVVPAGSGNDFARALNLRRTSDSLAAWKKFLTDNGNLKVIDLGTITPFPPANSQALEIKNDQECPTSRRICQPGEPPPRTQSPSTHYFATVAALGLDAEVARRANTLPRWLRARGGYILSLAPSLARLTPFQLKIELPSAPDLSRNSIPATRNSILAAFANTPTYGSGMKIAPAAKLDDAQLDICIIGNLTRSKLLRLFPTVYSGAHLKVREVEYFQSPSARIETPHPRDIYADGEYVCQTPAEISIVPQALQVITK